MPRTPHMRPLDPDQPPKPPRILNEMGALADINARLARLEDAIKGIAHTLTKMEGRLKFGIESTLSKKLANVDDELSFQLDKVNFGIMNQFAELQKYIDQKKREIDITDFNLIGQAEKFIVAELS